jgi:hypothetical protein
MKYLTPKLNQTVTIGGHPIVVRRIVARWCGFAIVVCAVAAYMYAFNAYDDLQHPSAININAGWQTTATALVFLQAILAWVLKRLQGGLYWFWLLQLQNNKPTERQLAVRQRVMALSYGITVVLVLLLLPGVVMGFAQYAEAVREDLLARLMWIVLLLFVSLPSILAAWQKDS